MSTRFPGFCFLLPILISLLSADPCRAQVQFERHTIDGNLRSAYWVYATDMDGDGDLDLVSASRQGADWWQNSSGIFSKNAVGSLTGAWAVHAADVDQDGDVDVMAASSGIHEFAYWRRTGTTSFSKTSLGASASPESIHASDFDGDGDLDIVGAAWEDDEILWWEHTGNGKFTRRLLDANLRNAHSVFSADLDNDGVNDVVACGVGQTRWYRNDGKGNFERRTISSRGGWSVYAVDLDGDGDNDVLRTQRDNGDVVLFKNNGGSFSEQVIEPGFGECWSISTGDIDGDGRLDVVGAGMAANEIRVWLNSGNGTFGNRITVDNVSEPRSVFVADLDNDGDQDIAAAIRGDKDLAWYELAGSQTSVPKSLTVTAPNGGESLVPGSHFQIVWSATGALERVRIETSLDNGLSWTAVANDTGNDGVFDWVVPNGTTNTALIRISDASDSSVFDTSDQAFLIASQTESGLTFTDITLTAGTGGPTGSGDTGGHAALFADVTGDNSPDLFITMLFNGPKADLFFRNVDGHVFADEAGLRGLADIDGGSHGAAFGDLDNDGDYDLVNGTTFGVDGSPAVNNIYRNNGTGFFADLTDATRIPQRDWPTRGIVLFDMDKDGDLDILGVTNFQGSADPPGERNEVYRNNGGLTFSAVDSGPLFTAPAGQGATDTDYDGDGDIDILAANRTGDLNILRNDGFGNFDLIPPGSIGITHQAGDGVTMADIDNDGDLDALLVSSPDGALYRNNGDGTFSFLRTFVDGDGYMGGFADLDNDTDLDLVFAGDSRCYLNDGLGNYSVGPAISVDGIDDPRAIAFSDIDNDGDLDFAVAAKRSRNWLVRNDFDEGNWLKVQLVSPSGQAGAFGAKTRLHPAGQAGGTLIGQRESRSSNGYLGQNDPVLHFGLGAHTIVDVVVTFLKGTTVTRANILANQTITIDASGLAPKLPEVTSFNPTAALIGTEVTILGDNLLSATEVVFNGVPATYSVVSINEIRAQVPNGATTGRIRVTNSDGIGFSQTDFMVNSSGTTITTVFPAVEDAYVRSSRPTETHGTSSELRVRKSRSADRQVFLKFSVNGVGGPVSRATLRLFVTGESEDGGSIHVVSNNYTGSSTPWTEDGLSWENSPGISNAPLNTLGPINLNETVEFDVTAAVTGNGIFSFAVKNESSDIAIFSSKEGAVSPELIVESSGQNNPLPSISSFIPVNGVAGDDVTVFGSNFNGVNEVTFNGVPASSVSVDSNQQLRATVPLGATTGPIALRNAAGASTSPSDFEIQRPPTISSFAPVTGSAGTEVTVLGSNFSGLTGVLFNGLAASSFSLDSDSVARAIVPAGASAGPVTVMNAAGTASSPGQFIVRAIPGNTTLRPADDSFVRSNRLQSNYGRDEQLTVRNTRSAEYNAYLKFVVSGFGIAPLRATLRLKVVDAGDEGGHLFRASNNYKGTNATWLEDDLTWENAPEIIGAQLGSIDAVQTGETIEIDVTSVIVGDGTYTFMLTNNSAEAVGYSSKDGDSSPELFLESGSGGGTPAVLAITSISPVSGEVGTEVIISGSGFDDVIGVSFNGAAASGFTIESGSRLRAVVPAAATTGQISIASGAGIATSENEFIVMRAPVIVGFTPTEGPSGTQVTISGSEFANLTAVLFNGEPAESFNVISSQKITAIVPPAATTGKLRVSNLAGSDVSVADFAVTEDHKQQTVTFVSVHDSFVRSSKPLKNYGFNTELRARVTSTTEYISYLKFVVTGLAGVPRSAKLRLQTTEASSEGGILFQASNQYRDSGAAWTEDGLIWDNAPDLIGSKLADLGPVEFPATVELDVTDVVTSNGTFTFAVKGTSSDAAKFSSREGGNAPALIVEIGEAPSELPVVDAFSPTTGAPGTEVTISGSSLSDVTAVSFNGTRAAGFVIDSPSQLRAVVAPGTSSGKVSVTNAVGSATSDIDFSVAVAHGSLSVSPTDDSFVRSSRPTNTYGSKPELRVRQPHSDSTISFLKFEIAGIQGGLIQALLRLHVLNGSDDGGSIFSVSNNFKGTASPWEEGVLNWTNAPRLEGPPLSKVGSVHDGETVEFDVTSAVTTDGIYSFAIINDDNDIAKYSSAEGIVAPELVLEYGSSNLPIIQTAKVSDSNSIKEAEFVPEDVELRPNYPNPFNLETSIEYTLPTDGKVQLVIYNLLGQEVRKLVDGPQIAGLQKVRWNGKDKEGHEVGTGVYFIHLEMGNQKRIRKITIQK